jgi:predicted site-specific integrase-resolvase
MNKPAAIYARVSSDRQKENHTIASQTAALVEHAQTHGYSVPPEWVFQDEGYSGAILVRPGLEALRDLAAEGQIAAVLVYSPDRLSRKYAYQVLLMEEFARHDVETVFIKAPQSATPEDQLLLQFHMIAEYERAQILERSRRGKRHRALQGGGQCALRCALRLSLHPQERAGAGVLRRHRGGSRCGSHGLRDLYRAGSEHRRHHTFAERARRTDAQAHRSLGPIGGLGHVAQPGL